MSLKGWWNVGERGWMKIAKELRKNETVIEKRRLAGEGDIMRSISPVMKGSSQTSRFPPLRWFWMKENRKMRGPRGRGGNLEKEVEVKKRLVGMTLPEVHMSLPHTKTPRQGLFIVFRMKREIGKLINSEEIVRFPQPWVCLPQLLLAEPLPGFSIVRCLKIVLEVLLDQGVLLLQTLP